jgi:spoIIIJ-associated protein
MSDNLTQDAPAETEDLDTTQPVERLEVTENVGAPDADADEPETADAGGRTASGLSRRQLLEREGEVAADFLETLLDICDLDGDIDVDIEGDRAAVSVVDSEDGRVPRRLVGQGAQVLEALQELTRLAVAQSTGVRSRLMLDVGEFRAKRRADLTALAGETARRVGTSGQPERLAPMNPFERKVVHDVIASVAGVHSESEGEEPNRRVVVLPDK